MPSGWSRTPSRARERVALGLGLGSAVLIAGAALAPLGDPGSAARAEFASSAARLSDAVAAELERRLADPAALGVDWRWEEGVPIPEREPDGLTALGHDHAAAVLAREAARLEAEGRFEDALATADEALVATGGEPCERGAARLVALRCARALGRDDVARAHWSAMVDELAGDEVQAGTPLLALGALAAADALDDAQRAAAQALLVERWCSARLALPDDGRSLSVRDGDGALLDAWRAATPRRDVLRARVVALAPGGDAATRLAAYEEARARGALERALGHGLERPGDARWHLEPWRGLLVAWRADGTRGVVASLQRPADLGAQLVADVQNGGLVPEGFVVDFRGDGPGQAVRPARELAGASLAFTLRHRDPEAAVRARELRLQILRVALLVTALVVAGASLATQRALSRSRLLAAREREFVANVSHELRTPVASILMLAENLEGGRVTAEPQRARYFALIRREAERLRRLVGDLLDASRLERGKRLELAFGEVELADFGAQLVDELEAWSQRTGFALEVEVNALAGRARLDADAVNRCLVNLVENARRHSGAERARVEARVEGERLLLAVEDAGRGVPPTERERVFEPFARVEREGGAAGTGLGLAIVREIARAHGGDVRLVGARGARFELDLPLDGPADTPEESA